MRIWKKEKVAVKESNHLEGEEMCGVGILPRRVGKEVAESSNATTNHALVDNLLREAMRKKKDSSSLSFIFKEALEHAQLLEKWRVQKVKRECNFVAHELAQLARHNRHTTAWLRHAPACVLDLIKYGCSSQLV